MLVWDNQQATSWFVGILEGEGWFRLEDNGYKRICIQCNDKEIIDFCERIYTQNHILFSRFEKRVGKKIGHCLSISNQECKILYHLIQSKLQCRLNEFQRIIEAPETTCELSIDFAWLIGIFEAEGSLYFKHDSRNRIIPSIAMTNSGQKILDRIKLNLKALDLAFYLSDYKPDGRKPYTQISITGHLRIRRFLLKVKEAWRSTRNIKRSNLMLEFVESRLRRNQNEPYNDRELQIYNQVKDLNR